MLTIVPYDSAWPVLFDIEAARIRGLFGELALRVEHVGSTAVPGLAAKAVVDIQVSVRSLMPMSSYLERLAHIDYQHIPLGAFDLVYPFFQKPAEGPSTHHVHLCVAGSEQERNHLAFRDYLRSHPLVGAEYVALKHRLASAHDGATLESQERYSLSKSQFVASVLARAFADGYPSLQHDAA
jgi:GrpB-like predicted nucleotidyltransferase (UPF0157 family)